MRFLRFLYWVSVWFVVYLVAFSVSNSSSLIQKFTTSHDLVDFAGSIYDLFIAVLAMMGLLVITIVYNSPEKEIVQKKEETTTHLEVR